MFYVFLFFHFPRNEKCKTLSFSHLTISILQTTEHVLHFPENGNIPENRKPFPFLFSYFQFSWKRKMRNIFHFPLKKKMENVFPDITPTSYLYH